MPLGREERERAEAALARSQGRLHGLVAGLSEAPWLAAPAPEAWSPAAIVEHLIAVEARIQQSVEAALGEPPAEAARLDKVQGKERLLERAVPDRSRRVPAPPSSAAITGRYAAPGPALADFDAARAATRELLGREGLSERLFPHFVLGDLTLYQWILLLALHTERHCLQIEEALAGSSSVEKPRDPPNR